MSQQPQVMFISTIRSEKKKPCDLSDFDCGIMEFWINLFKYFIPANFLGVFTQSIQNGAKRNKNPENLKHF